MNHSQNHQPAKGLRALLQYPVLVLFGLFFAGLLTLDLITPDRARSELENTNLTQRPKLTALSADGLNSFFTNYTKYVKDQVFARDGWISLQSAVETVLLQKTENGGILLGEDGKMFPRTYGLLSTEERTLPKNIAALEALSQRYPGKVTVMLAPSAACVEPEAVPAYAPLLDEDAYLDQIAQAVEEAGGRFLDLRPVLKEHKEEYIYYRADHHWTTLGAYYGYSAFCEALGLTPFDRDAHTAVEVEDFYGTHYSKARTWNAQPDTLTYYELDNRMTVYKITGPGMPETGEEHGLYDLDKLSVYDKYAAFLYGNNGLSRIEGEGEGRILVLKDSYANCFVPYLTANYAEIDVLDFRNYNYGLDKLAEENQYDQILVLYSFDGFKNDMFFYRAGIAG